ncbi:hypothetical protein K1719_020820 [Acacia pycnantha]|nr:hypothetical protein K1719_020820 [Acacia pycnantha]
MVRKDWRITWKRVYREGNRCADFLASFALSLEVGYHSLAVPPEGLSSLLREDAEGTVTPRLCFTNN